METVLVTAIGSFAADIVIKTLSRHGFRVIGCDIYPKEWIVDAYSVDAFYQVPLGNNEAEYLHAICHICMENHVDYLIPLTDIEIDAINCNRQQFNDIGTTVCISPRETINICRNKLSTYDFLYGKLSYAKVIPTYPMHLGYNQINAQLPIVMKPMNGRSSAGLRRIDTSEELRHLYEAFDSDKTDNYLVQPQIQGSVVTVDIIRQYDGKTIVSIPRLELLRTPNGAGTTVHVFHNDLLSAECAMIATQLGIIGCVNFEFIKDENETYHFLECNPRFSGGIEFSCLAGYDFVLNHIKCFKRQAIDAPVQFDDCYIARKYEETITSVG